jgi:hypothetical protein
MSLTNSKIEFAVAEDGRVFSYETGRHYEAKGLLKTPTGSWDLAVVKANIMAGLPVSIAFTPADATVADKVEQADADFKAVIDELDEKPADAKPDA